jgi:hypothetical protein
MSYQPDSSKSSRPRDAAYWAEPVSRIKLSRLPSGAISLNVEGRHLTGPLQGFGQMWQKTYRVRLSGVSVTPTEVIKVWKENFPSFWPRGNRFYRPLTGIVPGEIAVLNLAAPGGMHLSTGVMVIYADDESFTFMTPEGHLLSAWITFSAYEEDGCTVAQAQALLRATDPLSELGLRLGGHRIEDNFWHHTLRSLAAHFGVQGQVQQHITCVDPKFQWSGVKNIWYNSMIRTTLYTTAAPLRWVRDLVKK